MPSGLFNSVDITQDMNLNPGDQEIVPSVYAIEQIIEELTYNPTINILTTSISEKPTSATFNQTILGEFIDSITSVEITAPNDAGASVSIVSETFSQLNLSITTNADIQTYTLIFKKGSVTVGTLDFDTANLTLVVPSLIGTGQELWQQPVPLPANNEVTLSAGRFESEQNNGEGWNNHAYYGNFTGAFTKIVHEFTHNNDTNAYCYIRFNNTFNVGTAGNPRVYIQNGNLLRIYGATGAELTNSSLSNGDKITVEFTPTTMTVFVNGSQVANDTGTYTSSMQGSYVNFTSFRFNILTDIQTKLIE